jgi:hypothetical protein
MVNRNRSGRFDEFAISLRWLFAETQYLVIGLATISFGAALAAPNSPAPIAGTPGYVPAKDNLGVISGTVESEKGPVAGATVLIVSAKPLSGPQILEPTCYPDCLRSAVTDKAGSFSVAEIDGTLRYRLLIGKESYESRYVDNVAPRSAKLGISLRRSRFLEGKAELSGRVLDIDNRPVAAAAVIPRGYKRGDRGLEGPMDKIASVEIADSEGYFWIYTAQPVDSLTVEVRARGFASTRFEDVPANRNEVKTLTMPRGVSIQGRLLKDNQPVGGAVVAAVGLAQVPGPYYGPWQTITDPNGGFKLPNVTPQADLFVFGKMESLKLLGGTDIVRLKSGADGSTLDVGELTVHSTNKLSGRVVMNGDHHEPSDMAVYVNRLGVDAGGRSQKTLFDRQEAKLGADGSFEIQGLPNGLYGISVNRSLDSKDRSLPPYHLSTANRSLDALNPFRLLGLVERDTVITIGLEPGKYEPPDYSASRSAEEWTHIKAALEKVRHSSLEGLPREVGKNAAARPPD